MLSVHTSPLAQLGGKEAGGMNVYVRELARELGRRNVAVDIFTRSQKRGEPQITEIGANARVVTLRTGPAAPYDKNWVLDYLPEFVGRVRCFADDEDLQYDLIHSHYWVSGVAALELRKMWGTPVIQMFHTLGAMKNQVAKAASWSETDERIVIEGQLLREADAIVAATPLDRNQMIWNYAAQAERIIVIPCGVDTTTFHPTPQAEARAVLHLPKHPTKLVLFVG
ncbi:MAG: glycosyltransferase, partial [Herpetosiphonaceae bacterium]|nr:glycosyltransferase [Herpetosiphonaceae bacterium]